MENKCIREGCKNKRQLRRTRPDGTRALRKVCRFHRGTSPTNLITNK